VGAGGPDWAGTFASSQMGFCVATELCSITVFLDGQFSARVFVQLQIVCVVAYSCNV